MSKEEIKQIKSVDGKKMANDAIDLGYNRSSKW